MSRTTILVLVALGAALAGFAFSSAAKRLHDDDAAAETSAAASPQTASLDWRETYGSSAEQLVFSVDSLTIGRDGWRARLGLENSSSISFEVNDPKATLDRSFGLMLFSTGEPAELDELNSSGKLPAVRPAASYDPELPAILEPGASWEGTISAPGALVADSWVRVVFGTLVAIGPPPEGLGEQIVWITDGTYRLRE
ncbi:MAG: hypothetical protein H0U08_02375 [Actinobacteria bacterium]|nr:hypothetical protein [Actinomycetota bacterium]